MHDDGAQLRAAGRRDSGIVARRRCLCGRGEVGLPALTYQQIFQDPRLQALIEQALVNNRDLMVAASNIAAAREQYRIQRAQQFPTSMPAQA